MKTLALRHQTALPIREISALTVRASGSDRPELLAVGDEDFAVIASEVGDDDTPTRTWRHDLFLLLVGTGIDLRSGSGFEGVASDGEGTVLLMQEEEARLLVLSADLSRLVQVLALAVPEDAPAYGAEWHAQPNARGEGILLLERGHILVAKQKKPVRLIEFGPAGDAAGGIGSDTVLAAGSSFQRPEGDVGRLVPLADWALSEETSKILPSVNDIAFGEDGCVYVLSAEARVISRLEKRLEPGERARATESWTIDSEILGREEVRPEGLALVHGSTPVVGVDSKVAGDNLLVLRRPTD
jgi:hypothetical protein